MFKKIIAGIVAALMLVTNLAYANSCAVYDLTPGIEVLKSVSTNATANWSNYNTSSRISSTDGAIFTRGRAVDTEYGAVMSAGGDLYDEVQPKGSKFWTFEVADKDYYRQTSTVAAPEDIPVGKWSNFFATSAAYISPSQQAVSAISFANSATGDAYLGDKADPAPGSTMCVRVGLGKNDWHFASLGIRIKLSREDIIPGEAYTLSYYAVDDTAERAMYSKLTLPTQIEPSGADESVNWVNSTDVSIGKVKRYWTQNTTTIIPKESDFDENGYTVLWLGCAGDLLTRTEGIYFDSISLTSGAAPVTTDLSVSVKVKSPTPVTVTGTLLDTNTAFTQVVEASDEYKTVNLSFKLSSDDPFFTSEQGGTSGEAGKDKFKIYFTTIGASNALAFYVKDVSIQKTIEPSRFADVDALLGRGVSITANLYAADTMEATTVLAVTSADEEYEIASSVEQLAKGKNTVSLSGVIPDAYLPDSYVTIYVKDGEGNILSERKQLVARLFKNGVDISNNGASLNESAAIFGKGVYLVEFNTASDKETATISIGGAKAEAVIADGYGMCELTLTADDIAAMTESTAVSATCDISDVTVKKIID